MVITSSTQWTIPLSSSSIAASSPCLTKHGSVLGLKTCQLSAPPLAIASGELHDLHSTSSRRLLGAPDVLHRRSAGSFRQLVNEDICGQTLDLACIDSPDWLSRKKYDASYDGIAMPWSSSSRHLEDFDSNFLGVHAFSSITANVDDLHGEITAEDVDLLPIPGMLSCPSPFYADSYISHAQYSPKSSKIKSIEAATSPESSANSCKSSVMFPNHLGLPPNFDAEVEHPVNAQPAPPPADAEHTKGGSSHIPSAAGIHVYGKDIDNFNELLSGLWTSSALNCDADNMLDDSGSLASIFNVFPQKFHGVPASVGGMDQSDGIPSDHGASQLAINDMHHLVNPIAEAHDTNAKVRGSFPAVSTCEGYHVAENRGSMLWEAIQESERCIAMPQSNQGEPKSAHLLDTSVNLSESSLGGSIDSVSPLEKNCEAVPMLGMKRPFSMLQLAGIASSMPSTPGITCANAWHPGLGIPIPLKDQEVSHNFSTMLYKAQRDPKLAGFYYHMAKEQAKMEEEMQPQPSPAKVRRKHGTAMDPQSVAARSRREKFSERIRILQSLVPNGERLDTVSMLGQTFEYVRYLQHQVWQLYHGKDPASPNNICEKWKDFVEAERGSANLA